jgi:hypothetical protein
VLLPAIEFVGFIGGGDHRRALLSAIAAGTDINTGQLYDAGYGGGRQPARSAGSW